MQASFLVLLLLAAVARAQRARGALDLLPDSVPPGAASAAAPRFLQYNFLCVNDPTTTQPLSDAGCTNVTAGELRDWGVRGLPAGVVEVRGGGPPDFANNENGLGGARRKLLAPPTSSPTWSFPADTTTCIKATDVQRASLVRMPPTAACGTVDLVGSAAGNVAASFRPFPPGPNLPLYPDMYVWCGASSKCSSTQCQAGASCQTAGYYTQVLRTDPVRTPSACGAQPVGTIILNLEFRAPAGRQYDRSTALWVNDAVLFHGTTSQPSAACTQWTVRRDVSHVRALFAPPPDAGARGGVMMELDNTVSASSGLTSPFWVRAWLTFYPADAAPPAVPPPPPADLVLPLTNLDDNAWGRWFMTVPVVPSANPVAPPLSLTAGVPYRALVEVWVDPHECEEFWFQRPAGFSCSNSNTLMTNQYRELQVLLDGIPIGIQGIFPVWYTGGYSPNTWLSMAGQHAHLGLPYVFDVTPWVHLLGNGASHTFSIQIGNSNANFWYVSANLLVWRDAALTSVTPASEVLATPSLSSFALNGGTLAAPRSLSARRVFTATGVGAGGQAFNYSLTAEAVYGIASHSNRVGSASWDNRQSFSTAFTLTRSDGTVLHNLSSNFSFANTGRSTTRYDFDTVISLNQTDTARTMAAGLLAASAGPSRAAKLSHWQGSLSPTSSSCRDATGCKCAVPALTCGTCRASRARLEVTPAAGADACLAAWRYAAVTSCKYSWLFDTPTSPTC